MPVAHVLVPVKRLDLAKTRLSGVLSAEERAALMRQMLEDVLAAIAGAGVSRVTLVTSQLLDLGVARWDDRGLPWNEALRAAMREIVTEPCAAVVSADLPLLRPAEIESLLEATPERGLAIARASDGGTNAVSMRPPAAVMTRFGEPGSALRHARAARAAGLEAVVLDLPGLAFDVDTEEDLARLRVSA